MNHCSHCGAQLASPTTTCPHCGETPAAAPYTAHRIEVRTRYLNEGRFEMAIPTCPTCGAELTYDPPHRRFYCAACNDYSVPLPAMLDLYKKTAQYIPFNDAYTKVNPRLGPTRRYYLPCLLINGRGWITGFSNAVIDVIVPVYRRKHAYPHDPPATWPYYLSLLRPLPHDWGKTEKVISVAPGEKTIQEMAEKEIVARTYRSLKRFHSADLPMDVVVDVASIKLIYLPVIEVEVQVFNRKRTLFINGQTGKRPEAESSLFWMLILSAGALLFLILWLNFRM